MSAQVEVVGVFTDNASGGVGSFGASLGNLGNIVTGIKSAFDLAGQAIDAAVGLFTPFVDSASDAEQSLVGLETVLESTGQLGNGFTSLGLQTIATNLQSVTRYSDEQIQSAEAMLLRFENLNDIFPEAIQLTTDYAASLGIDLTTAAQTVGKALDDPASGIGRLNTQFKLFNETEMETIKQMAENGDVAGAQALIMERLTEKVGGAADAYGSTFAGQLDIAKNAADDLREVIGGALLPKLTELLQGFTTFVTSPEVKEFASVLAGALATGDFSELDNFAGKIFLKIADSIENWVSGSGPDELSDKVISFLDGIGSDDKLKPKAVIAAEHLFKVLGEAIQEIDWAEIGISFDDAIARVIENTDWTSAGDAFGDAVENFFTRGWNVGVNETANNIKTSSGTAFRTAVHDFVVAAIGGPEAAAYWASAFENLKDHIIDGIFPASMPTEMKDKAREMATSILDGLKSGISRNELETFFNNVAQAIIDIWKFKLGIASPSTVFAGFGRNIVEGLMQGWTGLFSAFKSLIGSGIDDILKLFAPFLALFGVDTSSIGGTTGGASGTFGGFGGGSTGGTTGGGSGTTIIHNNYGTVYYGYSSNAMDYDCPSPHPLVASSGNQLVTSGF